jgi:hypothetical protein
MKDVKWYLNACLVLALFGLSGCKFAGIRLGGDPVFSSDKESPPVIDVQPVQPESQLVRLEVKDETRKIEATAFCTGTQSVYDCLADEQLVEKDDRGLEGQNLTARIVEGQVKAFRDERFEGIEGSFDAKATGDRVDIRFVAPASKELRIVMGEKDVQDGPIDVIPDDKTDTGDDKVDPVPDAVDPKVDPKDDVVDVKDEKLSEEELTKK